MVKEVRAVGWGLGRGGCSSGLVDEGAGSGFGEEVGT